MKIEVQLIAPFHTAAISPVVYVMAEDGLKVTAEAPGPEACALSAHTVATLIL